MQTSKFPVFGSKKNFLYYLLNIVLFGTIVTLAGAGFDWCFHAGIAGWPETTKVLACLCGWTAIETFFRAVSRQFIWSKANIITDYLTEEEREEYETLKLAFGIQNRMVMSENDRATMPPPSAVPSTVPETPDAKECCAANNIQHEGHGSDADRQG